MTQRRRSSMGSLAEETARQTDIALRDEEARLLIRTNVDWESLRPNVTDEETYNKLIAVVNESTSKNESIAQLQNRIKALGENGLKVAKQVISLIT